MSRLKTFNWPGWSSFAFLLFLWELGGRVAPGYRLYLPSITAVIDAGAQLLVTGVVAQHLLSTLERFLTGYLIAAAIGLGLASVLLPFAQGFISFASVPASVFLAGLGCAVVLALVGSMVPAWRGLRLQVADALADR